MKFRIIEKKRDDGGSYYIVQSPRFKWRWLVYGGWKWVAYGGCGNEFISERIIGRFEDWYKNLEFSKFEEAEEAIKKVQVAIISSKFKKTVKVIRL